MKEKYRYKIIAGIFLILIGIILDLTLHVMLNTFFMLGFLLIVWTYKEKRAKKAFNDELSKWVECKSALNGMISGFITSLALLEIIGFNSELLSKEDIILTIAGAMVLVFLSSYIYYLKIKKNKGY